MTADVDEQGVPLTDKMHTSRALAIEAYAKMEFALCRLLALLLGTSEKKSSIIFYTITSSRARNTIIKAMLSETFGDKYDVYWFGHPGTPGKPKTGGLMTLIRQLDSARNDIVHWQTIVNHADSSQPRYELRPGHFWHRGLFENSITSEELIEFSKKADFVVCSILMFENYQSRRDLTPEALKTWPQIFGHPALYPPSNGHPLSANYKARETPPHSFET
jgi:hypothetical protein